VAVSVNHAFGRFPWLSQWELWNISIYHDLCPVTFLDLHASGNLILSTDGTCVLHHHAWQVHNK